MHGQANIKFTSVLLAESVYWHTVFPHHAGKTNCALNGQYRCSHKYSALSGAIKQTHAEFRNLPDLYTFKMRL